MTFCADIIGRLIFFCFWHLYATVQSSKVLWLCASVATVQLYQDAQRNTGATTIPSLARHFPEENWTCYFSALGYVIIQALKSDDEDKNKGKLPGAEKQGAFSRNFLGREKYCIPYCKKVPASAYLRRSKNAFEISFIYTVEIFVTISINR